ncbi:MAG: DUF5689 domain-containing protein [Bacteroidales bacterium]|jgi:hypothetical protein|nr:DUF5689 domain-containing protein [Bacteroidales bacterium]
MKGYIAFLSIFSLFILSCDKELDQAPVATYDGAPATHTIAQLLEKHAVGASDSYDSVPKGVIISGIVVSSDEHGNCYKYITIQDSTAGIQIKINSTTLYHKYRIGQRVFVKCDGLVLGDYRKLHQLGWWANGSMEAIASNREANYIFRDGLSEAEPTPVEISAASQLSARLCNKLIKLTGATFVNGGTSTFSESYTSTSRNVNLNGGGTVILRTSNYADFAADILPDGTGSIVGILTRYNNDYQLTIRSLDDLDGFVMESEVFNESFTVDPFSNGWTNVTVTGSKSWRYISSQQKVDITGSTDEENNVWMISPAIDLRNHAAIHLSLTHRMPNDLGNAENAKLYYSTTASSTFSESDWTELPLNSYPTATATASVAIPDAAAGSANFKLAFRYHDQRASNWTIEKVVLTSTTIQ